jgi:hypothetical protein
VQAREIAASPDVLRCVIDARCGDDVWALDVGALVIFLEPVPRRQRHVFLVILSTLNRAEASIE